RTPPLSLLFPYTTLFRSLGPSSHSTLSASRPLSAAPVLRATTATPPSGWNFDGHGQPLTSRTCSTPGTFRASAESNDFTLPPVTDRKNTRLNSSHVKISY